MGSTASKSGGADQIMLFIETASTDPAINLAYEEYFLTHKPPGVDLLMLWRNQPAVVIGRYQSIFAEVNLAYTQAGGIPVLRRISGGGAVFHDTGNLCFSLIMDKAAPGLPSAADLLHPVVQALTRLGLAVESTKRNDLTLDGKKFSGHAMMVQKDRFLLHGTLLFDSDLGALEQALASPFREIETKAIHSVRSRVTNLRPYLPSLETVEQFKFAIKDQLLDHQPAEEYRPTAADLAAIETLGASKYRSWAWTFGSDPPSHIRQHGQYEEAELHFTLHLEKGFVQSCRFDSAALHPDWEVIEQQLTHVRFDRDSVQAALQGTSRGEFMRTVLIPFLPFSA
jgi:lipoate---protein ligase